MDKPRKPQDEECPSRARRAFLTTATVSLTSLLLTTGCSVKTEAPNEKEIVDRAVLNAVPSNLVTFRETSRLPTGMSQSRGIALGADGAIWAVGDGKLVKLTPAGAETVAALPAQPGCIAVSKDGRLYIGLGNRVGVYSHTGLQVSEWEQISPNAVITSIAPAADRVWVADWAGKLVHGYDLSGKHVATLCARDEASGYPGIIAPSPHLDVAAAGQGFVHVANPGMHRVELHSDEGRMISSWGAPGSDLASLCGCCNPVDFAMYPGTGGFVTGEKGIPRVKIYSFEGRLIEVVAGPDQFASNTMSLDIAVRDDGSVLVLDAIENVVRIFVRIARPPQEETA